MSEAKRLQESTLTLLRDVTHWRTGERFTLAVEDGVVVPAPRRPGAHARVFEGHGAVVEIGRAHV